MRALVIAFAAAAFLGPGILGQEPVLSIIPRPRQVVIGEGSFPITQGVRIVAPRDKRSVEIAAFLRAAIRGQVGRIPAKRSDLSHGTIRFAFDQGIAGDEAYRLTIDSNGVKIEAANTKGFFWAVQTLRQLIPQGKHDRIDLPAVNIEDSPDYAYRGHMLDVARHFFDTTFLKKQIDLLSFYKINTFRLHLTDDQGWRIEIKRYPNLTNRGAWRTEPGGTFYGGFYTQKQIKDLVEYARVRNVTIIPEIEMPGHAVAAIASYPELSCRRKPIEVTNAWGVHKDVFCAGDDKTFDLLQGVLDEIFELFPAPFIHIGGDEVPKDRWSECPRCQLRIRSEGLKDENGLQAYFIGRIRRYVESKGKTLIGWDEILEGGIDPNAVVEVWRGDAESTKALNNGNRIIVAGQFYFDAQPKDRKLKDVYNSVLVPGLENSEMQRLILGAECPLWTEHVNELNAESMLYPRLQAFAENLWSGDRPGFKDFRRRLSYHYRLMDAWNVGYGPEDRRIAEYRIRFETARKAWLLSAEPGMLDIDFRYTVNGTDPVGLSRRFKGSVEITRPGSIRVTPFRGTRAYASPREFRLAASLALGKPIKYARPIHESYHAAGDEALVDGVLGSLSYSDGIWSGWWGEDVVATVDLERIESLSSVTINFLQQSGSWIILPRSATLSVSNDAQAWKTIRTIELEPNPDVQGPIVRKVEFGRLGRVGARFVRVAAQNYGKLPPSHNGAGNEAWLFADEITIK